MRCLFIVLLFFASEMLFSQQLPIRPVRTIAFTTSEGTDMDVDISPDSKTLVFDGLSMTIDHF